VSSRTPEVVLRIELLYRWCWTRKPEVFWYVVREASLWRAQQVRWFVRMVVVTHLLSGNTGIGLALAASVFGYDCVICIAETQSEEKKQTLTNFGAYLMQVPAVPYKNDNNYVHVAKRLSEAIASRTGVRAFYANQWDNHANLNAHYSGTGPEIYEQLNGKIDAFSCAMGTGGTLTGTASYLKEQNPDIKIALTDPRGSALYRYFRDGELRSEGSSITEGIGQGRITGNMEGTL